MTVDHDRQRVDVALITEGTYPHAQGGVSVWCDQMIRGLAPLRFSVYAICPTGTEQPGWPTPVNVAGVIPVPLWAPTPRPRQSPSIDRRFRPVFRRFVRAVIEPSGTDAFLASMIELFDFAQAGELPAALLSDQSVRLLLAGMGESLPQGRIAGRGEIRVATIADTVALLQSFEHLLRPLAVIPPEATLSHSVANGLGVLIAMAAKHVHGTPFVLTEHGMYLRERFLAYPPDSLSHPVRWLTLQFFRRLTEAAYQIADVIAPGSEYNRQWEHASGADPGKIRAIHNGIDPDRFPVALHEPEVPTLTWVGRIDPLKDVETLLRAFAIVRAALPDARLRIFGGTPEGNEAYYERCVALRDSMQLGSAATFEGRVPSVLDAYHGGHVVLLTSISEGFPYVVLEAMAAGRPTVSTDVGGVGEAVGDAGLLVPPHDPGAIAAACLRLLADDGLRRSLGRQSRRRVRSLYTLEQCVAGYEEVYRRVTAPRDAVVGADPAASGADTPSLTVEAR